MAQDLRKAASYPLDPKEIDNLNASAEKLKEAEALMIKAEQAGMDVSAMRAKSADIKKQLIGIRRAFFPGR